MVITPNYSKIRQFQPDKLHRPRALESNSLVINQTDVPIWLEIGAGVGMHAITQAAAHPQVLYFAIERTAEKFTRFNHKAKEAELLNLYPIHADALPWTVFFLPPASVEKIFILYPNPEPHNSAQRWLNMPFFEFLLSRLKHEGVITLASNIESYINEAFEQAQQVWQLDVQKSKVNGAGRTHFEIKYLQRGESCQELKMKKPANYVTRFDHYFPEQKQI